MLGKNNGVIALLWHIQPNVIAVHCSRHHLELAFKDTLKSTPTGEKVNNSLIWPVLSVWQKPTEQNQLEECIQMSWNENTFTNPGWRYKMVRSLIESLECVSNGIPCY